MSETENTKDKGKETKSRKRKPWGVTAETK